MRNYHFNCEKLNKLFCFRYLPASFRREVLKHCQIHAPAQAAQVIEEPLKEGVTRDTLPEIASQTLPRIVPHVILNRREEVIPLLLSVAKLQSNPVSREKLLQILFNLQKRPHDEERQLILTGKQFLLFIISRKINKFTLCSLYFNP